jgi:predicted component of viral defense system (DUF524 family)
MGAHKVKIRLKNNQELVVFISPKDESDIFVGGNSPYADFQLIEGKRYYFELDNPAYLLAGDNQIITSHPFGSSTSTGDIFTGNYVGTFSADVKNRLNGEVVGEFNIEIRSKKIGYESDYRKMMEDITEFCTDLLMRQSSPVTQRYTVNEDADPQTEYQRFAFVRSLIESPSFDEALLRVESQPLTKWRNVEEERSICNIKSLKSSEIRQLATSHRRISLPATSSVSRYINTIPERIHVQSLEDTTDVPENRFIKFVLNSFLEFCLSIRHNKHAQPRLRKEADEVCERLFKHLANPLFRRLGNLTSLPLNSPVLQKRAGYREILQKWLMFDMAAKLAWDGGEDVYNAGQRNVARLYEYWLFLKLLNEFSRKFKIPAVEKSKLLQMTDGNLGLCLREGRVQTLAGSYTHKGRKLNIEFSYNKTFGYSDNYAKSGSWSRQMRPDYTLSIWPGDIKNAAEAEKRDVITHIHFDAKYRVDNLLTEFSKSAEEDLTSIKHEEEKGYYKRADLLKMHTYKDAIRRTAGAYVLYPGTENPEPFVNFHEIIPGLGAFAISPRDPNLSHFLKFIDEVIDNFLNRTSLRERMQHHRYKDLQMPEQGLYDSLPEPYTNDRLLPDETCVMVGYTRRENLDWVDRNLMYPARIGAKTRGTIIIDKNIVSAKYLLSYNGSFQKLYKIRADKGLRVVTREELEKQPFAYHNPKHDNYMLFFLEPAEDVFDSNRYDLKTLNERSYNRKEIFTVMLSELMKSKKC